MDRSGQWLYVSTRLIDRMTVFRINPNFGPGVGAQPLEREQVLECPLKFPRSFALDPSGRWMVVAGETDNRITVLKIDAKSGQLAPTNQFAGVGRPVSVLFMPENSL